GAHLLAATNPLPEQPTTAVPPATGNRSLAGSGRGTGEEREQAAVGPAIRTSPFALAGRRRASRSRPGQPVLEVASRRFRQRRSRSRCADRASVPAAPAGDARGRTAQIEHQPLPLPPATLEVALGTVCEAPGASCPRPAVPAIRSL
ncbi:unnamed protein product, partial [Urochloa humidicola]